MTKNNLPDIKYLFEPRSVMIVGASSAKTKIGYKIVENIVYGKFPGKIYPVNPKGGELLGHKVYKTIEEIDGQVDIACITIPAAHTMDAIKSCATKGVKFLVVITSGFSEVGNLAEEREMVRFANENGMRVLGPNIFGLYSSVAAINATFGPKDITPGSVAIVTQSGALGIAMIGKTKTENIGLSAVVSVGNKSDIVETDLLEYLIEDENTRTIMMYIEGIKDGDKLVDKLELATKKKPIIVIKSGRSKRGAMAAASHTGSLAGADEIFSDIMRQAGVIRAESIQDALNWCKYFSDVPPPKGENTVIITNGGGIGVLAADASEKYGVALYDDIQKLKEGFSGVVPDFGSVKNPVDLTGQATADDYAKAINAALENDSIHSIICLACEAAVLDTKQMNKYLESIYLSGEAKKPMVFSFFGGVNMEESIAYLKSRRIPVFSDVYEAVSCLGATYLNYRNMLKPPEKHEQSEMDHAAIAAIIKRVRADKRTFLLAHEAQELMQATGVRMPQSHVARNIEEAVKYAESIGYPVVMKVVSKDIIHKSDAGGIALGLDNKEEVIDAYQAIIRNCRSHVPNALIEGLEVAEMVQAGTETIIGARFDNAFGPIVMFGLGGIYVEVMKDVAFRAFPLNRNEILKMISEIKTYSLLLGVRGEKKKDIGAIVETILKVGTILQNNPEISDIEVNPVIVYEEGEGIKALDVRILLTKPEEVA